MRYVCGEVWMEMGLDAMRTLHTTLTKPRFLGLGLPLGF